MIEMNEFTTMDCEVVGTGGIGLNSSTLAHSMIWFNGSLYLGATAPSSTGPEDAARILRFNPEDKSWTTVYSAPARETTDETRARVKTRSTTISGGMTVKDQVAREYGVRTMAIFKGKNDPHPCLYCGLMSLFGGHILRSEDGETFEPVVENGRHDDTILSFRGLTPFGKKLFCAPAGSVSREFADLNLAPEAMVYYSEDPAAGPDSFVPACEPAFGDPTNTSVFAVGSAHGYVYAGTASEIRGFQLWRTQAKGKAPFKWERVLDDGAFRFNHNYSAATIIEFDGDLYVGTGIPGLGYDRVNDVGPSAFELIRVHKDGSWDLMVGEPRFTPDGLKIPLSAWGAGYDDPYNSVLWAMGVHEGQLYVGTHQWEPYDWAMHGGGQPLQGGYQMWRSPDGIEWEKVVDAGLGRHTATGIRSMQSTPMGLFYGTSVHVTLLKMLGLRSGATRATPGLQTEENGFDIILCK